MPLVLLSYSVNTQALSATTAKAIIGSKPYLTFDKGITKATTSEGLLGITVSDGKTKTTYTPANNPSTAAKPIELPKENQSFADIGMLVPTNTNSIALSALIGPSYNYWGDDDGDGKGTNGVTATGSLSVSITDKDNHAVSRSTVLSSCYAPYKVVLTSTDGSITTRYGIPNSSNFTGNSATYYINPNKTTPTICHVRPNLKFGTNNGEDWQGKFAGPANIWSPTKGFLVQSNDSSSYNRNFPTTGANKLHFDLLVGNTDAATLTWPAVTRGGITATMTLKPPRDTPNQMKSFNPDGASSVRVTLTGPAIEEEGRHSSNSPGKIATPTLPQTFELVGYDSNHKAVIKYGFVLKQWFVSRSWITIVPEHSSWCTKLGDGYRLSKVKDLTNAKCGVYNRYPCANGVDGATPLSSGDNYQRNIGAGLFTEWGVMGSYDGANFIAFYVTSDIFNSKSTWGGVYAEGGQVSENANFEGANQTGYAVCTYP